MHPLEYIAKEFEMTFTEISNHLGVSKQTITDWIKRKTRKIPEKHLGKLSELFKIDSEFFNKEELNALDKIDVKISFEFYKANIVKKETNSKSLKISSELNELMKLKEKEKVLCKLKSHLFTDPSKLKKFSNEWMKATYSQQLINILLVHLEQCTSEQLFKLRTLLYKFPDIDTEEYEIKETAFIKELKELIRKHNI